MTRRVLMLCVALPFQAAAQKPPEAYPDVPYVPTPVEVVEEMLRLAGVGKSDIVYDLGSGDGRVVVTAAEEFGAAAVGVEIDPDLVQEARENARKARVGDKVRFVQGDLFKADIHEATVVTLYLLPQLNEKLMPKLLRELKPGTRIVSFSFAMGDWKPAKTGRVNGRPVYLWIVP